MKLILTREVDAFIEMLEKPTRAKWVRLVNVLLVYGSHLGMPHARRLDSTLSELRIRGRQEIRVFYTIRTDTIIMLHGFVKKTERTPQRELTLAKTRLLALTDI